MDILVQYGESPDYYRFNLNMDQAQIQPTFGEFVPQTTRLIGMDGAWNVEGRAFAKRGVGNVQATLWLRADNLSAMQTKRDALHKIGTYGMTRLFKERQDGDVVWTWAILNNLQESQSAVNVPHRLQQYTLNFQCDKAAWFRKPDDTLSTAGVYTEGATRDASNSVANGTTIDVTNNGTTWAGMYVKWTAPGGVTITNPAIERRDSGGTAIEKITYTDQLDPTDTAEIDARNYQLIENMSVSPSYGKLTALTSTWLQIPPGTTTLYVSGTFSGGNGTLDLDWWDTYI